LLLNSAKEVPDRAVFVNLGPAVWLFTPWEP
jgi:hypothetical protein